MSGINEYVLVGVTPLSFLGVMEVNFGEIQPFLRRGRNLGGEKPRIGLVPPEQVGPFKKRTVPGRGTGEGKNRSRCSLENGREPASRAVVYALKRKVHRTGGKHSLLLCGQSVSEAGWRVRVGGEDWRSMKMASLLSTERSTSKFQGPC